MKTLFLDLDGTVTESRQKISKEMKKVLIKYHPVIVISGASKEQMLFQLDGLPCRIMAQSGNDTGLWTNILTKNQKKEIFKHIGQIYDVFKILDVLDAVEDRGCQISLSMTGHHNDINVKKNYDPKKIIRNTILRLYPFKSKTLTCRVAGTTCFDYTRKDGLKGNNIARWIKENKLKKKDCIYYGDALFKGGNDESVIGVIKTVAVSGPKDLLNKLKNSSL